MKKLLFILCLIWSSLAYSQITVQATVKGFGSKIVIGYYKSFSYITDTITLNKDKAVFKFDALEPVYFKLQTIDPDINTPFLLGFPGDTITIEKDKYHLVTKGGAESYNTFLIQLDNEMRTRLAGPTAGYNQVVQYLLDRSEEFFSTFNHPQKQLIKDTHTLTIITQRKLYPLMVKYNIDANKMTSVFNYIKNTGAARTNDSDLFRYLDKVDFNNPNIGFANTPDIMMMNNLIRILRMHAVDKDSTLKTVDEYTIENKIIKDLFKESRYRSRLLAYNLYFRIDQYNKYPMQLAGADNFIADFKKEMFNSDLLPDIEKLYATQLVSIGSLSKGATAPAFKLPDTKGKMVSLSDFKGKVVYLDLWATWCGPCLKEMPYLKLLKEKFKNKNIEMITISIDTKVDTWLAKIAAMQMDGVQLIDDKGSEHSKIARDYKIWGVPHYVLIDKNGRIASAFAPRPSDEEEIEKQINALLN